jgi:hypothetical protein
VRGCVHRVRTVGVVLVERKQLHRHERLVVADTECRQLVVDTIHVHVERHRLDRTLLMHDTAPLGPLRALGFSGDTPLNIGYTLCHNRLLWHAVWGWASTADAYCS